MNYKDIFERMHPDFFEEERIRHLPENNVFAELILDLHDDTVSAVYSIVFPESITFGVFDGDLSVIHDAVKLVNDNWVQYFNRGDRFFCAFDNDKIVSFCNLDDMGIYDGIHIGGPGCVGTIPEYRKRGIGLEMVRQATELLKKDGYDLSWIHFTHLDQWYMKLGYQVILRWNCRGVFDIDC